MFWIWLVVLWVALDAWLLRWWLGEQRERRMEPYIIQAAQRYGLDPALVKAVVWRESRFREDARGKVGELGLMQVGELAGDEWAEAERVGRYQHLDLLDPAMNTRAGSWYLAKLMKRYTRTDRPEAYALADYNAGRANVLRWLQGSAATNSEAFLAVMDFPGTRDYVRSILAQREVYRSGQLAKR